MWQISHSKLRSPWCTDVMCRFRLNDDVKFFKQSEHCKRGLVPNESSFPETAPRFLLLNNEVEGGSVRVSSLVDIDSSDSGGNENAAASEQA
mmetsp:Transcript_743/g.1432  ORF Transcript_743/g.1432 Transcript_743/m.1432 type:complete len:92 (-) Transcript_743:906-1181(-)